MSLYNGIETDNVILNQDVSTSFYNRQKHFNSYLATVASRIRNGQSILTDEYDEDQLIVNFFQGVGSAAAAENNRALDGNSVPEEGSWLLVKNGNTIGAISYKKSTDQVRFDIATDDDQINNSNGQIIDADSNNVVTTFTISNGLFTLTEHLDNEQMAQFLDEIGSQCHKYYFSIIDDDGNRILSAAVCNPSRGIIVNDGSTATFPYTQDGTRDYPTRSLTITQRVTLLEELMGQLESNWLTALQSGDVSGIGSLDSHVSALLEDDTSETRGSLNDIFGGVLGENLAELMRSHLKSLQHLIIEYQPPTADVYMQYQQLIYNSGDVTPLYAAYINGSNIAFSTGSVTQAEFAFIYNLNAQAWTIQVNDSGAWKFVKNDGSIVSGTGPFTGSLDPGLVTGNNRLNSTLAIDTGVISNDADYNTWFYKITLTIGSPNTDGGNGRYEIREYDLSGGWMSNNSGSFEMGTQDDVILTTTAAVRGLSLETNKTSVNQNSPEPIPFLNDGQFAGVLTGQELVTNGNTYFPLANQSQAEPGDEIYYDSLENTLTLIKPDNSTTSVGVVINGTNDAGHQAIFISV